MKYMECGDADCEECEAVRVAVYETYSPEITQRSEDKAAYELGVQDALKGRPATIRDRAYLDGYRSIRRMTWPGL